MKTSDRELTISRVLDAPRELVWEMWTNPKHLAHWWGPKGMEIGIGKFELKPGGMFHYSMNAPGGQEMWGIFVYREIVAPERLVYVNSFADKDGNAVKNPYLPVWPLETLNTLTFTEHEGKTTLILKVKPINAKPEEVANFEKYLDSMQGGFAGTFEQLVEYLQKMKNEK